MVNEFGGESQQLRNRQFGEGLAAHRPQKIQGIRFRRQHSLKAEYRELLGVGPHAGDLTFVLLEGSKELIASRLAARQHEFMNLQLLDSQLEALEVPESALRIANDRAPDEIVNALLARLR